MVAAWHFRVSRMSANRWRRALAASGRAALALAVRLQHENGGLNLPPSVRPARKPWSSTEQLAKHLAIPQPSAGLPTMETFNDASTAWYISAHKDSHLFGCVRDGFNPS